ncbi:hypothetical protein Lal_00023936 [Lupinus albus]|nr:hypothetical protein Lal_00023936 [Lupinus albus]
MSDDIMNIIECQASRKRYHAGYVRWFYEDTHRSHQLIFVMSMHSSNDMFVGGNDTTSTVLEWTFVELMKNPIIMKKSQEEVRRVVGGKSKIEENDIDQMLYLKCVIKECLRLHLPTLLMGPRETISSLKLNEYDIPTKTMFIPFGFGRRGCPGMIFGTVSAEYVLASFLYWFDWKLPKTYKSSDDIDMSEIFGLVTSKKEPLHQYLSPFNLFLNVLLHKVVLVVSYLRFFCDPIS